jgi:hypothetical protein
MKKVLWLFPVIIAISLGLAWADVPNLINYQGYLTNPDGTPVSDGNYNLTFRIYDVASSGSALWTEAHNAIPVSKGLFQITLGSITPLDQTVFSGATRYLGIQIALDPELSPRLRFTSVAYAYRARTADTSTTVVSYPHDHDANYVNVNGPDSIRGDDTNYMLQVKNYNASGNGGMLVHGPGGYGIRIDTSGGNGIYITNAGYHGVSVNGTQQQGFGAWNAGRNGFYATSPVENGFYANYPGQHGLYVNHPDTNGVYIKDAGLYGMYVDSSYNDGIWCSKSGDDGIQIGNPSDDGVYVYNAGYWGVNAYAERGNNLGSDNASYYGTYVRSYGSSSSNPGLYVSGTFAATGTKSSVVPTSQGQEALYAIETPEVEFMASGTGQLTAGQSQIIFERLFHETISPNVPLKIILTPKNAFSGLYVASQSPTGFAVRTGAGEQNCQFDWMAIGRRKGYDERPKLVLPNEQEDLEKVQRDQAERMNFKTSAPSKAEPDESHLPTPTK